MTTKAELRGQARSRLAALSSAEREIASSEVERRVWDVPEVASAGVLLLYASTSEEVQTDAIAREALRKGIRITYPRCLPGTREMSLHRLSGLDELRHDGRYGIREPDHACALVGLEEIDAALVPGLAWDRSGTRLGQGAGYYDRLFARTEWRGFRCGLFFSAQELPGLPRDSWDRPLQALVTEREIVRFPGA
jgi:5-formyltetrahydrofolate cyclo-ligase